MQFVSIFLSQPIDKEDLGKIVPFGYAVVLKKRTPQTIITLEDLMICFAHIYVLSVAEAVSQLNRFFIACFDFFFVLFLCLFCFSLSLPTSLGLPLMSYEIQSMLEIWAYKTLCNGVFMTEI